MLDNRKADKSETYRIVESTFVISADKIQSCPPPELPELAIAGRSNVGKSSLINMICSRKNLAKTSSTPGKTRLINYFRLRIEPGNHWFHLVDLPGYGYSKVNKTVKEEWGRILEEYLRKRENLTGVIHLIDARHPPTSQDKQMREWLQYTGKDIITVLTKVDKLKKNDIARARGRITEDLKLDSQEQVILTSAESTLGKFELTQTIFLNTGGNSEPLASG
ncbi:MAG: ribosome biogenesis GTP-binding protein YihA/YsxC [bacterium]